MCDTADGAPLQYFKLAGLYACKNIERKSGSLEMLTILHTHINVQVTV